VPPPITAARGAEPISTPPRDSWMRMQPTQ
jgi:hypothetical protein